MNTTKKNLQDLSFFGQEGTDNIMALIDHCQSLVGSDYLQKMLYRSPASFEALVAQQEVIKFWYAHTDIWPKEISNGTIVMVEKYFESADTFATNPNSVLLGGKFFQKIFWRNEYHFVQFSLLHLADFIKGCYNFIQIKKEHNAIPAMLSNQLDQIEVLLEHRLCKALKSTGPESSFKEITQLSFWIKRELKPTILQLIQHYAQLDALRALAIATKKNNWCFPNITAPEDLSFQVKGLYHPLVPKAKSYDLYFDSNKNFMILTGANMSGKTTLMRSMGIAAVLAHLGMGIPAQNAQISFLSTVLTNMHVEDNISKGESFFMAEVKSIKHTAEAIVHASNSMILMDELFKGTNVHDAFECTKAIISSLCQYQNNIMILSTHLHEVAQHFINHHSLSFKCFETQVLANGDFAFDYMLKEGISNEKIGFKILEREGVIDILNKPKQQAQ